MVWYLDEKFSQDSQTPNKVIKRGKAMNCKYKIPKIKTNLTFGMYERQEGNQEGEKRENG